MIPDCADEEVTDTVMEVATKLLIQRGAASSETEVESWRLKIKWIRENTEIMDSRKRSCGATLEDKDGQELAIVYTVQLLEEGGFYVEVNF